jgi:hypothetical protein
MSARHRALLHGHARHGAMRVALDPQQRLVDAACRVSVQCEEGDAQDRRLRALLLARHESERHRPAGAVEDPQVAQVAPRRALVRRRGQREAIIRSRAGRGDRRAIREIAEPVFAPGDARDCGQ